MNYILAYFQPNLLGRPKHMYIEGLLFRCRASLPGLNSPRPRRGCRSNTRGPNAIYSLRHHVPVPQFLPGIQRRRCGQRRRRNETEAFDFGSEAETKTFKTDFGDLTYKCSEASLGVFQGYHDDIKNSSASEEIAAETYREFYPRLHWRIIPSSIDP